MDDEPTQERARSSHLAVGERVETEHFTFERFTRMLKVEGVSEEARTLLQAAVGSPVIRLTMRLWEALQPARLSTVKTRFYYYEPIKAEESTLNRRTVHRRRTDTGPGLDGRGLTEDIDLDVGGYTQCVGGVLTPLGELVVQSIPECPPEDEWPGRPKGVSTRLTPFQQQFLDGWEELPPSSAVPSGGAHAETSGWRSAYRCAKTLRALESKGAAEKGVRGISIVDGRLVIETEAVEVVYRLTVLGGLLKGGSHE